MLEYSRGVFKLNNQMINKFSCFIAGYGDDENPIEGNVWHELLGKGYERVCPCDDDQDHEHIDKNGISN